MVTVNILFQFAGNACCKYTVCCSVYLLCMKKGIKRIFLLSLVVLLIGAGYAYYIWNKPARDVSNETAIKISAVSLFDSFANNEAAANKSFLNKAVEVTGKVVSIKKNQAGNTVMYLQTSDPVFGINCTFKNNTDVITKGSTITFKGICTGYLSDVIVNNGILVK